MVKHTRMEENKRVYEADYNTDEYEDMTCECHHLARAKELNGSRRKPFFCIHCKCLYKDKNKLNLHRVEGCGAVTGDGKKTVLKIYPVFGKGQRGEIEEILIKHGYMEPRKNPSRTKRKRPVGVVKDVNVTSDEADLEAQIPEHDLTSLQPQKLKMRGMLSSVCKAKKKGMLIEKFQVHRRHREQVEENVGLETGDTVASLGQQLAGGELMRLTRGQVEAQAWTVANSMQLDASVASPPEVLPCPGLWHLMNFQLLPSNFPAVNDDLFLDSFREYVVKRMIDPALRSSYGTWYMEREVSSIRVICLAVVYVDVVKVFRVFVLTITLCSLSVVPKFCTLVLMISYADHRNIWQAEVDDVEQNSVKLTMSRFRLIGGIHDMEARNKEIDALEKYLHYLQGLSQYQVQKATAETELRLHKEKYVKDKLDEFDAHENAHKELALWQWSPLLHVLRSDYIGGVPPRPWTHSDAELREITCAIKMNRSLIVNVAPRCPIIVRMFKIVYLYCFDKSGILSDLTTGLLRETMLGYSTSESAAPVLKISAQSVLNEGYFLFANMPPYSEGEAEIYRDVNSLLKGPESDREAVVEKVQTFLNVVRQRAAGDMAQFHPKEFGVLWCGGDEIAIADSVKKFMLCLKYREDLDMGWVPFASGTSTFHCIHHSFAFSCFLRLVLTLCVAILPEHPASNSIALLQAKEVVIRASNDLYKQRVAVDMNRLLASPPCLPTIDSDTHQALVKSSAGKSINNPPVTTNNEIEGTARFEDVTKAGSESVYPDASPDIGENLQTSHSPNEVHGLNDDGCFRSDGVHVRHEVVVVSSHNLKNSSPDLNMNPGSTDSSLPSPAIVCHDVPLTPYVASSLVLNPVFLPKIASIPELGVQSPGPVAPLPDLHLPGHQSLSLDVPSFQSQFHIVSSDTPPAEGYMYQSGSRPQLLCPRTSIGDYAANVHVFSSPSSTGVSPTSFAVEATSRQDLESHARSSNLMFTTHAPFSFKAIGDTQLDSSKCSSASPDLSDAERER